MTDNWDIMPVNNLKVKSLTIDFKTLPTISDKELDDIVQFFKEGIVQEFTFQLTEEQGERLGALLGAGSDEYFLFALNANLPEVRLKNKQ